MQVLAFVWFAAFGKLHDASGDYDPETVTAGSVTTLFSQWQDVQVMIFFGLGMLYAFLRKHGFSSLGFNFMIGVLSIQLGIAIVAFVHSWFDGKTLDHTLTMGDCLIGEFAAATVLISWGGFLGRVTMTQLSWMMLLELIFYAINEYIVIVELEAIDIGGSMVVHIFAAYFGIAVSWALGPPNEEEGEADDEGSVYNSDIFSLGGTMFLWVFWPSFNSAFAGEEYFLRERAIINSFLSLCASSATAFYFSHLYHGQLDIVHIQNATLAGGVGAGTSCNILMSPWAAILIGCFSGFVSVTGYSHIGPWMKENLQVYDVAGIHSLHGMPGVIGGLSSCIVLLCTNTDKWGAQLENANIIPKKDLEKQALAQFLSVLVTLAMAIGSGVFVGTLIKQAPLKENPFSDEDEWSLPLRFSYHGGKKDRRGSQVILPRADDPMIQMATFVDSKFNSASSAQPAGIRQEVVREKRAPVDSLDQFDEPI